MMNLTEFSFTNATSVTPPECVLAEPLENHIQNLEQYSAAVLALTFDSGPVDRATANSYVFYFFRDQIDPNRQPDDILTFKVKVSNPGKIHIVDKYLGGVKFGAENAPPLAKREAFTPRELSKADEAKIATLAESLIQNQKSEEKKGGCFIATAAFGDRNSPHVVFLQEFRDEVLKKTRLGSAAIQLYYSLSPPLAVAIASSRAMRALVRAIILRPTILLIRLIIPAVGEKRQ